MVGLLEFSRESKGEVPTPTPSPDTESLSLPPCAAGTTEKVEQVDRPVWSHSALPVRFTLAPGTPPSRRRGVASHSLTGSLFRRQAECPVAWEKLEEQRRQLMRPSATNYKSQCFRKRKNEHERKAGRIHKCFTEETCAHACKKDAVSH